MPEKKARKKSKTSTAKIKDLDVAQGADPKGGWFDDFNQKIPINRVDPLKQGITPALPTSGLNKTNG